MSKKAIEVEKKKEPIKILTLGSDPEVFLMDESSKEIISAEGLIRGTKEEPRILEEGFGIQEDCVLAEITIPPSKTKDEFVKNMLKSLELIKQQLPEGLTIKSSASEHLHDRFLITEQARTGGCSPDFNAYTMEPNPKPKMDATNRRSAGTHLHLGLSRETTFEEVCQIVKYLDYYLGVPSIVIDTDTERRKLYGKAGCFRQKPYPGLEYRTLSGLFTSSQELIEFMWDGAHSAIEAYNKDLMNSETEKTIEKIINSGDFRKAKEFVSGRYIQLPKTIKQLN